MGPSHSGHSSADPVAVVEEPVSGGVGAVFGFALARVFAVARTEIASGIGVVGSVSTAAAAAAAFIASAVVVSVVKLVAPLVEAGIVGPRKMGSGCWGTACTGRLSCMSCPRRRGRCGQHRRRRHWRQHPKTIPMIRTMIMATNRPTSPCGALVLVAVQVVIAVALPRHN